MILLPISGLVLVCLVGKASTDILHCYECENCKKINDTFLRACPQDTTTMIPDNSIPETTSAANILPTTIKTTTMEPPEPTTAIIEPVSTLPAPAASANPGEDETATTAAAALPADEISEDQDDTEKVKRSVHQVSYRALMIRRFASEVDVSHHCYSLKGVDNDRKKIKRGCVKVIGNKTACDVLKEQYNVPIEDCEACRENKCNNGAVRRFYFIRYPILVLLIVLLFENADSFIN